MTGDGGVVIASDLYFIALVFTDNAGCSAWLCLQVRLRVRKTHDGLPVGMQCMCHVAGRRGTQVA